MIILSIGMPRAGSGWYYNLMNDLALAHGYQDARKIRQKYHLQGILTEVNCNIGALTPRRTLAVLIPSLFGNNFVIKAHAGPTPIAEWLIRRRMIRAAYIYRDPRDAMLSAYENGKRAREQGRKNAFSHLVDFDAAMKFMQEYVQISKEWLNMTSVLHTRYENLLQQYEIETNQLVKFLGFNQPSDTLQQVLEQYQPQSTASDQKGLHFSKGKTGRFQQAWNEEQQERMSVAFADYLQRMKYEA